LKKCELRPVLDESSSGSESVDGSEVGLPWGTGANWAVEDPANAYRRQVEAAAMLARSEQLLQQRNALLRAQYLAEAVQASSPPASASTREVVNSFHLVKIRSRPFNRRMGSR
jgi:hypothetical protein